MYFISLSLPKTGTSYLGNLVSSYGYPFSTSKIKEPSFFLSNKEEKSSLLSDALVSGNLNLGFKWYRSLFNADALFKFDLSTQYWIHPSATIDYVCSYLDPSETVFFSIKRDSLTQVKSYICQLRRGYTQLDNLRQVFERCPPFADYIRQMYNWNIHQYSDLFEQKNFNYVELDFSALTSNPSNAVNKLLSQPKTYSFADYVSSAHKNSRSTPRIESLNRLVFSKKIKSFAAPLKHTVFYPTLVNLRKSLVQFNLKKGSTDSISAEDQQAILDLVS